MNTMYIRDNDSEVINEFLDSPDCFDIVWKTSIFEESEEFDAVNQCMIEKTRHYYQIMGIDDMFYLSFYSEKFHTREEFVKNLRYSFMHNLIYFYNEEKEIYERTEF